MTFQFLIENSINLIVKMMVNFLRVHSSNNSQTHEQIHTYIYIYIYIYIIHHYISFKCQDIIQIFFHISKLGTYMPNQKDSRNQLRKSS